MIDFPHKITIPLFASIHVRRTALMATLAAAVTRRAIVFVAPAGYGKTALARAYIDEASGPVAWYALDEQDHDPWLFCSYLSHAVEQVVPGAMRQTLPLLEHSPPLTALANVQATCVREFYRLTSRLTLVLDDWHLVDATRPIGALVGRILSTCPHIQLMITSRTMPAIADLQRLHAQGQVLLVEEPRLRFSATEAAAVLATRYQTTIAPEAVAHLTALTGGWITPILLTVQAHDSIEAALGASPLRERTLAAFLAEQVLDQQPSDVATFLLESAVLPQFTATQCRELLGYANAEMLIAEVLQCQLWCEEIAPNTYRYQPLVRELLIRHLQRVAPQRYRAIQAALARAAQKHHLWRQAFEAALAAGERMLAEEVLREGGPDLYTRGHLATLLDCFAQLPDQDLDGELSLLKVRTMLALGQLDDARKGLSSANDQVSQLPATDPQTRRLQRSLALLQAQLARLTGSYRTAVEHAQTALELADEDEGRIAALRMQATCAHRLRQPAQAVALLREALELEQRHRIPYRLAQLQHDLGMAYKSLGQLDDALGLYARAEAQWEQLGHRGMRAMVLNSTGVVQHLRGQLAHAETTLITAREEARAAGQPFYEAAIVTSLADLYSDWGQWEQAGRAYAEAEALGGSALTRRDQALGRLRMLVRQQRLAEAEQALATLSQIVAPVEDAATDQLLTLFAAFLDAHVGRRPTAQPAVQLLEGLPRPDHIRALLLAARVQLQATPAQAARVGSLFQAALAAAQAEYAWLIQVELRDAPELRQWADQYAAMFTAAHLFQGRGVVLPPARPVLTVRTLGIERLLLNDQNVAGRAHKVRELLFYLLNFPDGRTSDQIGDALWPNQDNTDQARQNVRITIYRLNTTILQIILHKEGRYCLDRTAVTLDYDVERLQCYIVADEADIGKLSRAELERLYHGLYLEAKEWSWCQELRPRLEEDYLELLRKWAALAEQRHFWTEALAAYKRILKIYGLVEEGAAAGVVRCLLRLGKRRAALQQLRKYYDQFTHEMGGPPDPTSPLLAIARELLCDDSSGL